MAIPVRSEESLSLPLTSLKKTRACKSVNAVYRFYFRQSALGTVVSSDDPNAYGDWLPTEQHPEGKQAIVSAGIAHMHDLKEGDDFLISLDGTVYELELLEIADVSVNCVVLNCEDLGIPYNALLVEGGADVSSDELLADLSETTASELAFVSTVDALVEEKSDFIESYIDAGRILLFIFFIFSLIGVANTFCETLRTRKTEFDLYRLAGMCRANVRLMQTEELVFSILVGGLVGVGAFLISAVALDKGMNAYGSEVFLGIKSLFL